MQINATRYHTNINIQSENLAQQLEDLILELRAAANDPAAQLKILVKIKTFLEENKELIEEECAHNGWSQNGKDWTQHYDTFFNHALSLINAAIFNPEIRGANFFDALNELLTPLQWLMSNHK